MNVTDAPRAQSAANVVLGALGGHVLLALFSVGLTGFLIERVGFETWQVGNQLAYLVVDGALAFGLFSLAAAVGAEVAGLVRLAAIAVGASLGMDILLTVLERSHVLAGATPFAWDFNLLVTLGMKAVLLFMFVKTAGARFAWVIPLAAVVMVLSLARSAFNVASMHQLISYESRRTFVWSVVLPAMSMFNVFALLACGAALRAAVIGAPQTQAVVAQAGLQPPMAEVKVSPAADFLVGAILLVVGIGVSMVSYSAASGGGRYVVATGAIGVGLGRIIRGAIRAAKG